MTSDASLEHVEPPRQAVIEAAPFVRRKVRGRPYHEPIADDLLDDLHLAIGQGLALIGMDEDAPPAAIVEALAAHSDAVRKPSAPAVLALACLYGQTLARAVGWGWAHVRCTRRPGILLVSPGERYTTGPRSVIELALARGGDVIREHHARIGDTQALPASQPGRYLLVR
ncbi:MAG: hypothetical protein IPM35_38510 [Myxococcales bacterium]|nr:hypothetical protein [Myxococcales bacterium]